MWLMEVSARLTRWITSAYQPGSAERVLDKLRTMPPEMIGGQDLERIQAALVVRTGGDWSKFIQLRELAAQDWRDALVAADLADDDWPERLAAILD